MGQILTTLAGLMLVYGGTFGVEQILDRFATPEARSAMPSPDAADADDGAQDDTPDEEAPKA